MDNIDLVILKILQDNGRETASSISKRIHLSVSAVLDRIHKLEENGVVKKVHRCCWILASWAMMILAVMESPPGTSTFLR